MSARRVAMVAVGLAVFATSLAWAGEGTGAPLPAEVDRAQVGGDAVRGASGRVAFNQAAGHGNTQANLAAVALTADGLGGVALQLRQAVPAGERGRDASARIDGSAFHGGDGLLSINQAAGAGNAQANLIAIGQAGTAVAGIDLAQGIAGLDDVALAAVAGDVPDDDTTDAAAPLREAVIAGGALRETRGVMQVNQTAGVGNRSANTIVLLLPGSPP
jgi:hypothetical protein